MRVIIFICLGPILWACFHGAIYATHWLSCATPAAGTYTAELLEPRSLIAAISAIVAILLIVLLAKPRSAAQLFGITTQSELARFSIRSMRLLAGLSLFGVLAGGLANIALPACMAFS